MDNSSFPSDADDTVSTLPVVSLHVAVQVVLVILLAVGLVGSFVGNALLLILMVLGRKTLNSTGVYLIFLAVLNLIYSLIALEGMTAIVARYWVFGSALCQLTAFLIYPVFFSVVFIHPFLAADLVWYTFRPLKYKRRKLPAVLFSMLALSFPFITQLILSAGNFIQVQEFWLLPDARRFTLCRSWRRRPGSSAAAVLVPTLGVTEVLVAYAVVLACCVLYVAALMKLYRAQQARKRAREQVFKGVSTTGLFVLNLDQNTSFYGLRETETIKSLAGVFVLQVMSTLFPLTIPLFTVPTPPFWVYLVNSVFPLLGSQISLLLVLTNKLYRGRIADILTCSGKVEPQQKMDVLRARRVSRMLNRRPSVKHFSTKSRKPAHRLSTINESEEEMYIRHSFCNTVAPEKLEIEDVCSVEGGHSMSQISQGGEGMSWAMSQGEEWKSSAVSQGGEAGPSAVFQGGEAGPLAVSQGGKARPLAVSQGGEARLWAVSQGGEERSWPASLGGGGRSWAMSQGGEGKSSAVPQGGESRPLAVSQGGEARSWDMSQGGGARLWAVSQGGEGRSWPASLGGGGRSWPASLGGGGSLWAMSQGGERPQPVSQNIQSRDRIQWALKQISLEDSGEQGLLDIESLV